MSSATCITYYEFQQFDPDLLEHYHAHISSELCPFLLRKTDDVQDHQFLVYYRHRCRG